MLRLYVMALAATVAILGSTALARVEAPPELLPWTYDHTCLSHQGPADLDAMVINALTEWGRGAPITDCGSGSDIQVILIDAGPAASAGPLVDERPTGYMIECGIFISPEFFAAPGKGAPDWWQQAAMTHEVGHCMGLDHPVVSGWSVMIPNVAIPTAADLAILGTLYPWPHATTIGGVSRE